MSGGTRDTRRGGRGRRVAAQHVLNFSGYEAAHTSSPPGRTSSAPRRRHHVRPRRREHFVAANSRFALNAELGAAVLDGALTDPDRPLHWDAVDVVFVEREAAQDDSRNCPICLQTLSCAKITPCGHVFDHVCLLQHVAHSHPEESAGSETAVASLTRPNTTAKCPLCSNHFAISSLKNVAFREVTPVKVGGVCEMTLVSTAHRCTIAAPFSPSVTHIIPKDVSCLDSMFSRFVFASRNYLMNLLADMANDVRSVLASDPSLKRYVDIAMKDIKSTRQVIRRRQWNETHTGAVVPVNIEPPQASLQFGDVTTSSSPDSDPSTFTAHTGSTKDESEPTRRPLRLFYQSHDARNVFLHPVNHRCLLHENGGFLMSAKTCISGPVLEIERYTMDETTRKRYRFLKHLPEGCEFMLVELDLSKMLSKETLSHFKSEFSARKSARSRRKQSNQKESERVNKMQTESLHDYFRLSELQRQRNTPHVDRNDESSFPALGADAVVVESTSRDIPGSVASTDVASSPGGAWGGPAVSSYSSVTSNMGLFPALGASSATLGATSADVAHSPPIGVWANSPAAAATATVGGQQSQARRQRRGQGTRQTFTLLSNGGSPYRR